MNHFHGPLLHLSVAFATIACFSSLDAQPVNDCHPLDVDYIQAVADFKGISRDKLIDLGNGLYQYIFDPEIGTEPPEGANGVVEWQYAGQATYTALPDNAQDNGAVPYHDKSGVEDTITRLKKSRLIDRFGRLFVVKRVNEDLLDRNEKRYNRRVERLFGSEQLDSEQHGLDRVDPEPQDAWVHPASWIRNDQDSDGDDDRFRWNGDGRILVTEPLSARQEMVVKVHRPALNYDWSAASGYVPMWSWATGSGILVERNWVLTTAHTYTSKDGNTHFAEGSVSLGGAGFYTNSDLASVEWRVFCSSYDGHSDLGDDLVLLRISEPFGAGGNFMPLSSASNSKIKSKTNYNIGYPGRTPGGAFNTNNWGPYGSAIAGQIRQSAMYRHGAAATYTSRKILGTRIDMSDGHSGGPIYYFQSAGKPFLIGIMAAHNDGFFNNFNGGPKIPYHRSWIIAYL